MNKSKLYEQAVKKPGATDGKTIAKKIYDSKGYLWDDPNGTVAAIKQIKTVQQYQAVNNELKKLTSGLDIATYLKSFLDESDKKTWELILSYLKTQFSSNPEATLYPVGKVYFNLMNRSTDPSSGRNGIKYVSPAYSKWWKERQLDIISGISASPLSTITKTIQDYRHELMIVGQLGTAFIPLVGPFISAGLGFVDAKMYYDEGHTYEAGLSLVFAAVPGGAKLTKGLIKKIVSKSGVLTKIEREFLIRVATSKDLILKKINGMLAKGIELGTINPEAIKSLKWIRPAGEGAYNVGYGTGKTVATGAIYDAAYKFVMPSSYELFMQDISKELYKYTINALK